MSHGLTDSASLTLFDHSNFPFHNHIHHNHFARKIQEDEFVSLTALNSERLLKEDSLWCADGRVIWFLFNLLSVYHWEFMSHGLTDSASLTLFDHFIFPFHNHIHHNHFGARKIQEDEFVSLAALNGERLLKESLWLSDLFLFSSYAPSRLV